MTMTIEPNSIQNDAPRSIYLVKVTRPPVLMKRCRAWESNDHLKEISEIVSKMQAGGLAPPGISIQLVDSAFDAKIKEIKAGSLTDHGIPVLFQINGV